MLKKILKSTLILAAVGIALGFALPYLAPLVGLTAVKIGITNAAGAVAASYSPAWLGAYFGAFGAINATIESAVGFFSGPKKEREVEHFIKKDAVAVHAPAHAPHPDLAPELDQQLADSTSFQDRLNQTRPQGANFQEKLDASQATQQQLSI